MKKHEEISKKIIALMGKNNIDIHTTSSLTYGSLCIYSIETDGHKILYEGCDDDYHTLTDVDALTELYDEMRLEYDDVHISELTEEQVIELVEEITWNSIYHDDYNNTFGVDKKVVCSFAEGFLDAKEEELGSWDKVFDFIETNPKEVIGRDFYYYIQSVEE